MQLSAAGLFKYLWPFSGHQALRGETLILNCSLHKEVTFTYFHTYTLV